MAARFWNLTPWAFRDLTAEKQAEVMATYIVSRQIDNYYDSEQAKRFDEKIKKDQAEKEPGTRIGSKKKKVW